MKDRIKQIVEHFNLSTRAFALRCGLKQNTLNNQVNGVYAITLATVEAILNTFPEVSAAWLLSGTGEMLTSDSKESERIEKMTDTISILTDTIVEKNNTIDALKARIAELEKKIV